MKFLLLIALCSSPVMAQYATPTYFIPISTPQEKPWRIFIAIDASIQSNAAIRSTDKGGVNVGNGQLELGLIRSLAQDFDVGLGLHGGFNTVYVGAMFGLDAMVRYLPKWTDVFYGGFQAQLGYNYSYWGADPWTLTIPGLPPISLPTNTNPGDSSLPIQAGLVVGAQIQDAITFYLFPAIELGQTLSEAQAATFTADSTTVWKKAIGMQIGVGTAIDLGSTKLTIQARPRMANLQNNSSWGVDVGLGAYWDF